MVHAPLAWLYNPRVPAPARPAPVWALATLFAGCSEPAMEVETASTTMMVDTSTGDTGESSDTGDEPTGEVAPPSACPEGTTVTAAPRTIGEAVEFINALPRPLTLDCFLERLERPLAIAATSGVISLQPAGGVESPRVFLFSGELIMSIALDRIPGDALLEFGEIVGPARSIKAELEFPLKDTVTAAAPFERILDSESGTKCAICHRDEAAVADYPGAFASAALQMVAFEEVPLADMRGQYERCGGDWRSARCERLAALLGHGEVVQAAFPAEFPTIYYDDPL
jgi:hypothetical protein